MTSQQSKTLVFVTGGMMATVTLLEASGLIVHAGSKRTSVKSAGKQVASAGGKTFKELWGIAIAMIILAFLSDMVPDFAGPLALLILVAYLVKKAPEISAGYTAASQG